MIPQMIPGPDAAHAARVTVIKPHHGLSALDPVELWRRRDLAWVLALRDLRVRYKQTLLGVSWAVIQPLATMIVLHIFFGKVMGMADKVGGVPYPVFLYAGLQLRLEHQGLAISLMSLLAVASTLALLLFPATHQRELESITGEEPMLEEAASSKP